MKIKELFEWFDDEEDETLGFIDNGDDLLLNINNRPPKYVYRSVGKEEFDNIQTTGVIAPSGFYGRTHVSAVPVGGDGRTYKVLKIKYNRSDKWKSKSASTGVFATTWEDVPADRIVAILDPATVKSKSSKLVTMEDQFKEYQGR